MPLQAAAGLAQDQLARWLIENSPSKLQIAKIWPFTGVRGGELSYARQNSALNAASQELDCAVVSESVDAAENVTFPIRDFITRYQICFADQDRFKFPNDLDATEYALAVRRLLYGYFEFLDAPIGNGGLLDQVDSTRIVDLGGTSPLTLDCMDDAYQRVVSNDGRPTVIMTSSRGLRTYQSLTRAAGYEPPKVPYAWYDPATRRMKECEAPAFNGTPILINDMMESFQEPDASVQRIWFLVLGDDGDSGPTRGVHGIVPEPLKNRMFVRRETNGSIVAGAGTEVTPVIDVWVSWPVGLATGS